MQARRARLRSLAKINLALRVLNKRPDAYHELRTVFQTVSLADTIDVEFTPGRGVSVELDSQLDMPAADNLIVRAAHLLSDALKLRGLLRFRLSKRIPMGGGLGGGSSNAAAVLLAVPVLAGRRPPVEQLAECAAQLGSDVPFFLYGGAAVGLGRGTELYPLPDVPEQRALIVAPGIHVSTAEAYRALNRGLTGDVPSSIMNSFQMFAWQIAWSPGRLRASENDFEGVVFGRHPALGVIKRKLRKHGASPALMSGSGSSVFGVFATAAELDRARADFPKEQTFPVRLVNRRTYQKVWFRQLAEHLRDSNTWPPQSRYAK